MGQKTNPTSLRLKTTNKNFASCWYSDIYYPDLLTRELRVRQYLNKLFAQIKYPNPCLSICYLSKKTKTMVIYLNPLESRRRGCERFQLNLIPEGGSLDSSMIFPREWSNPKLTTSLHLRCTALLRTGGHQATSVIDINKGITVERPCECKKKENTILSIALAKRYKKSFVQKFLLLMALHKVVGKELAWRRNYQSFQKLYRITWFQERKGNSLPLSSMQMECAAANVLSATSSWTDSSYQARHLKTGLPITEDSMVTPSLHLRCTASGGRASEMQRRGSMATPGRASEMQRRGSMATPGQRRGWLKWSGKELKRCPQLTKSQPLIKLERLKRNTSSASLHLRCTASGNATTTFFANHQDILHKTSISFRSQDRIWRGSLPFSTASFQPRRRCELDHQTVTSEKRSHIRGFRTVSNESSLSYHLANRRKNQIHITHLESTTGQGLGSPTILYFYKSVHEAQAAQFVSDEIAYFLERRVPFRRIKQLLLRELKTSYIEGVRVICSGRVGGRSKKAQRAREERFQWGQTSSHVFSSKLSFAFRNALTPFGKVGIKVWICYK